MSDENALTRGELVELLAAMEARTAARMEALEERLEQHTGEHAEKIETRLLTAFHNWSSPVAMRMGVHEGESGLA